MHERVRVMLALIATVLLCQGVVGAALYFWLSDWTTRGQFGDMCGVANTLSSGLAFAALIYTILLQRDEPALQREELQLTRVELQRTANAQEASQQALALQASSSRLAAELTAVNYLLAHFSQEIERLESFTNRLSAGKALARTHREAHGALEARGGGI
jgi:predicted component of type VI protein secretion system